MYANGQRIDNRTKTAIGISVRDNLKLTDIIALAVDYANNF